VVDLDSYQCSNPAKCPPELAPGILAEHQSIYETLNSYTERSPSGKGLHVWVKGKIPSRKRSDKFFESYSEAHYFTVTGDVYRNSPIMERQEVLNQFSEHYWSQEKSAVEPQPTQTVEILNDPEVCTAMFKGANNEKITELWKGRWQGNPKYPSQSEADQALMNYIWWYSKHAGQSKRLFLSSELGKRDKAKRNDYLNGLIATASRDDLPTIKLEGGVPFQPGPFNIGNELRAADARRKATFRGGNEIEEEATDWLWEDFLPTSMLTMFAGEGGTGKSTMAYQIAAIITTGGTWPDGTKCNRPGNVLIWSSEDPAEQVIKPRLMAAGADPTRWGIIEGTTDNAGNALPFNPAKDMSTLEEGIVELYGVSLIIIDPILSLVEGDANAANNVRASLQPTLDLVKSLDCAVIGISHFTKNSDNKSPVDRVLNSQAFTALARMNWAAVIDEKTGDGVFTRIKTNIAPKGGGFGYRLEQTRVGVKQIKTQRVVFTEALTGSAREIIASVAFDDEKKKGPKRPARFEINLAKKFLFDELRSGKKHGVEVAAKGESFGYSPAAMTAAKEEMGVTNVREGYGGIVYWKLP
jgi:RecA-family ATPase